MLGVRGIAAGAALPESGDERDLKLGGALGVGIACDRDRLPIEPFSEYPQVLPAGSVGIHHLKRARVGPDECDLLAIGRPLWVEPTYPQVLPAGAVGVHHIDVAPSEGRSRDKGDLAAVRRPLDVEI